MKNIINGEGAFNLLLLELLLKIFIPIEFNSTIAADLKQIKMASCSKRALEQKLCTLNHEDRQIRLSRNGIFLSNLTERKVFDFPETDEKSDWEAIEWIQIEEKELLHIKTWSAPEDKVLALQHLRWTSFFVKGQELTPFFDLKISNRRKKSDGQFQLDPILPVEIKLDNGELTYFIKEDVQ